MGLAFMYTAYFQLFYKFIGTSLFGLVYSIFIVNHFLWIQEICIKYKVGELPTIEKHHPDV